MTWVVLAAISLLLTISYGIVVKGTLNNKKTDYDPIAYASAMFIFVGLAALVIWLFSGTISRDLASLLDPKIGLLTLINVVVYTICPSFYYRALKNLPYSIVTIVYSLSGLFAFSISIFFHLNSFYLLGLLGSFLIVASVVLVSFKSSELKSSRYLLYMFLATFFYSLAATIDSQLVPHYSITFYTALTFGIPGILIMLNFIPLKKFLLPYQKKNYLSVITNGSIMGISLIFIFASYRVGGTTAQVYSILAMEAILSVIFSAIFLKDRKDLLLKIVAAVIAGFGVYLLTR